MLQITGRYQNLKDENFVEYMKAMGCTEDIIEKVSKQGIIVEVCEEGNNYTFKTSFGVTFSHVLNEEFEEPLFKGAKGIPRREGNNFIVESKTLDGLSTSRVFQFTEKGFIVVFTVGDVVAKRYYKKL